MNRKRFHISELPIGLAPIILSFITLLPLHSFGQKIYDKKNIDQILIQLKNSKADTNRIKLSNELARAYLAKAEISKAEFEIMFRYLRQAVNIGDSLHLNFGNWQFKSQCLLGGSYIRLHNLTEGKKIFMDLVDVSRKAGDKKKEAESWAQYGEALHNSFIENPDTEQSLLNAVLICREAGELKSEIDMFLSFSLIHTSPEKNDLVEREFLDLIKKSNTLAHYRLTDIYCGLAYANRYKGKLNKALDYSLQSIRAMKYCSDSSCAQGWGAHFYYGETAQIYESLHMPNESAYWYKKCLDLREGMSYYSQQKLFLTYRLLIVQLIKAKKTEEALATILALAKRSPPTSNGEKAALFHAMADCYLATGDNINAEKFIKEAVYNYSAALQKGQMYDEHVLLSFIDMTELYVKMKRFEEAEKLLTKSSRRWQEVLETSQQVRIALLYFKVDSAMGNYFSALKKFQLYKALNDTMFNDAKSKQIERLKIEYETEKKDQDLLLLTRQGELQRSELQQTKLIQNVIAAGSILLVIIIALLYMNLRHRLAIQKQLQAQQQEINSKNVALQQLVKEKDWLVKEIHHRVKNSFQSVVSLFGTQAEYIKNEEASLAIEESKHRIQAMSLVHQKLYQSENLSSINIEDYVHELVDYLRTSFETKQRIQFNIQVESLELTISYALPIGLILNEAITNSFKYAFPNEREGILEISLKHESENQMVLNIADNGVGLPDDFDTSKKDSMGMNLMKGLSEQIDGSFSIENKNGVYIRIVFPYQLESTQDFQRKPI